MTYLSGGGSPLGQQSRVACRQGLIPHSQTSDFATAARRNWVVSRNRPPDLAGLWHGVMTGRSRVRSGSRSRVLSRVPSHWSEGVWVFDHPSWIVSSLSSTCRSSGVSLVMESPWCRLLQSLRMRSGRWLVCRWTGCGCCRALGRCSRSSSRERTACGDRQDCW